MKRIKMLILKKIMIFLIPFLAFGMSSYDFHSIKNINFSNQFSPSLAPMIEKVIPSVVSINIEGTATIQATRLPHQFQPFFGDNSPLCQENSPFKYSPFCHLNGGAENIRQKFRALGSGVIINAEKGYAVTNHHVVEHANKIQVQLNDGRRYDAKVIGKDLRSDIALIQLQDANNLKEIKIADSDRLKVGDYTVAIGNPYGLGETVTSGIISALGRTGLNIEHYENFIQTDAAINRGNSGGALVNLEGELIGINTAILAPDGGNIGIGFAIPINMVKNLTSQIMQFGQIRRGELGIVGMELNSDLAKIMKINTQKGAFVKQVLPNSSAFDSGIKAGDIIISLNKKTISSFSAFRAEVSSLPINTKIELGIFREGQIKNFPMELKHSLTHNVNLKINYTGIDGLSLSNYLLNGKNFIKVNSVEENSLASKIGFKKDDIILKINQKPVMNLEELKNILETKPQILVFNVKRGNYNIYLVSESRSN